VKKRNKWKSVWGGNFDMQLTPLIAVHMTAAIGAVMTGPFALWARMGSRQRPWLHPAAIPLFGQLALA